MQSIAQNVWGDGSLWYKIAEANGLSGDASLAAGQALSVPLAGPASRSNAGMFRPYDTASAVGDLNPTSSKPPKKKGGGLFGKILLAVIAIAVAAIVAPWATALIATQLGAGATATIAAGVIGGAIGGAAGSIVGQGVGLATGIQDKFDWKGVAMSAIGGGIGGGIGQIGKLGQAAQAGLKTGQSLTSFGKFAAPLSMSRPK